ncbi:MAG: rod shape-determining protein [Clostridia bacterium]|nr:rod shape-determining protein [Clostridia bacterium]
MFGFTVAADIGSSETRLASRTGFVRDETRVALDPDDSNRVLAVGAEAGRLLSANSIYPVRGSIANVTLTAVLLRRFALSMLKRRSLAGVSLRLALPPEASSTEISAALGVGREAGFADTGLMDGALAGAVGAGVDVSSPEANLTVNIGRDRTSAVVTANGGVVSRACAPFGSSAFDSRIQAHFAVERGMLVSFYAAEKVKKELRSPLVRVHGRDSSTGQPLMRAVKSRELSEAAEPVMKRLAAFITGVIGELHPDAAADLLDTGITLIGGGANMYLLPESLERLLGIGVRRSGCAESAVILGLRRMMSPSFDPDKKPEIGFFRSPRGMINGQSI